MLIVAVAIGGSLLHFLLSLLSVFQWLHGNATIDPAGFVTVAVVLAFVSGFVLIMRMPDSETKTSDGPRA